jgi:hypothetical protein
MSKVNIAGRNFLVEELSKETLKELADRFKCPPSKKAIEEILQQYKATTGRYFHLD